MQIRETVTPQQAEALCNALLTVFKDRDVIAISVIGDYLPSVDCGTRILRINVTPYSESTASLLVVQAGAIITGLADWEVNPNQRTIHARTKNGPGQICRFTWVLSHTYDEESYQLLKKLEHQLEEIFP